MSTDQQGWEQEPAGDDFERRLARQPLRPAPRELRAQILAAARSAPAPDSKSGAPKPRRTQAGWLDWLLTRFPVPALGLAAAWTVVLVGTRVDGWLNGPLAQTPVTVSAEQMVEARAQRAELWQLAGVNESTPELRRAEPAEPPRPAVLRPRGDRRRESRDRFGGLLPGEPLQFAASPDRLSPTTA